jgi:ABC-type lipoprotein export system ATPase subunit
MRPGRRRRAACVPQVTTDSQSPRVDPLEDLIVDAVWVEKGSEPGSRHLVRERRASSAPPPSAPDDVLRVLHVAKRFGGVVALRDINLHLRRGETLGLVGDNASGKPTLLKIIAGFQRPDAGQLVLRGAPVDLRSVDHARSLGIDCVYQDLALIDELSAAENIFLGRERVHRGVPFLARRLMRALAREALDDLGVRVDSLDVSVGRLSGGQRPRVACARRRTALSPARATAAPCWRCSAANKRPLSRWTQDQASRRARDSRSRPRTRESGASGLLAEDSSRATNALPPGPGSWARAAEDLFSRRGANN